MQNEILIVLFWWMFMTVAARITSGKWIHVIAGLTVIPLTLFIRHWQLAAIPVLAILSANFQQNKTRIGPLHRYKLFLFAVVSVVMPATILLWLWNEGRNAIVVIGVLVMTFGDAMASLLGKKSGGFRFRTQKSLTGMLAFATTGLILIPLISGVFFAEPASVIKTIVTAFTCATAEAISPGAWDNGIVLIVALVALSVVP